MRNVRFGAAHKGYDRDVAWRVNPPEWIKPTRDLQGIYGGTAELEPRYVSGHGVPPPSTAIAHARDHFHVTEDFTGGIEYHGLYDYQLPVKPATFEVMDIINDHPLAKKHSLAPATPDHPDYDFHPETQDSEVMPPMSDALPVFALVFAMTMLAKQLAKF